jgi:hypothetical protein
MKLSMLYRIMGFLQEEIRIYLRNAHKKPIRQQIKEISALKKYYKYIPYHYIKHCMYLKSFEGDIFNYIPPEIVHRYRDNMNPKDARDSVIDKKKFSRIMMGNHVPVLSYMFSISSDRSIRDIDENIIQFNEFKTQIIDSGNNNFFIKPSHGGRGQGIYKMTLRDHSLIVDSININYEDIFFDKLFLHTHHDEFIIQPEFQQHDMMNSINPSSVNTIRIVTFVKNNNVINNTALLRMSNGTIYTDNWATGGIIVNIDMSSGFLDKIGKTKSKYGRLHINEHPLTYFRFENAEIPFWLEVKELVKNAALILKPLKLIGWDVAIGKYGPVLVEANHDFDVFMSQEASQGLRQTPVGQEILETLS